MTSIISSFQFFFSKSLVLTLPLFLSINCFSQMSAITRNNLARQIALGALSYEVKSRLVGETKDIETVKLDVEKYCEGNDSKTSKLINKYKSNFEEFYKNGLFVANYFYDETLFYYDQEDVLFINGLVSNSIYNTRNTSAPESAETALDSYGKSMVNLASSFEGSSIDKFCFILYYVTKNFSDDYPSQKVEAVAIYFTKAVYNNFQSLELTAKEFYNSSYVILGNSNVSELERIKF